MATEKWISGSGQGLTWGSAFGTEINSIVNGNAILSSIAVSNGSPLDIFADLSFVATATSTSVAPAFLGFYIYPLNQDGSTYGDGRFGTSAGGPPPGNYFVGSMAFAITAGITILGSVTGIIIPPGTFKFLLHNQSGGTLSASNTIQYRTYNRAIA